MALSPSAPKLLLLGIKKTALLNREVIKQRFSLMKDLYISMSLFAYVAWWDELEGFVVIKRIYTEECMNIARSVREYVNVEIFLSESWLLILYSAKTEMIASKVYIMNINVLPTLIKDGVIVYMIFSFIFFSACAEERAISQSLRNLNGTLQTIDWRSLYIFSFPLLSAYKIIGELRLLK